MNSVIQQMSHWINEYLGLSQAFQFSLFKTVLLILVAVISLYIIRHVLDWRDISSERRYLARKTLSYIVGFLCIPILWRIWLGGYGLATYLGIVSAGLAIALQDPVANLAGWIFILIRQPFRVGDRVAIGTHAGDVIDMRLFQFTLVEIGNWVDADQSTGRIIHIPNGLLFKMTVCNYNQGFNFI